MTYRQTSITGLLREAALYLAAAPRSRMRQLEILQGLDDDLLADIGVSRRDASRARAFPRQAKRASGQTASKVVIRNAAEADLPAIQAIYAGQVLQGFASFEEEAPSVDDLLARLRDILAAGLPYLVAELDGRVVGYSYASSYRPRSGYRYTVEDSVYVAEGMQGRGVGRALLAELVARCETGPWRQMVAVIGDSANAGSIALHEGLGFRQVGTLQCVGFKLGRFIDTVLMQRPLPLVGSSE